MTNLVEPKTYTLFNFTTPANMGNVTKISIYLNGPTEGSIVRAVIFADEPDNYFPQGSKPIAQSTEVIIVNSIKGQWYNFTFNFPLNQNTAYWLGFYSGGYTRYFFDEASSQLSLTSQPNADATQGLPFVWHYTVK